MRNKWTYVSLTSAIWVLMKNPTHRSDVVARKDVSIICIPSPRLREKEVHTSPQGEDWLPTGHCFNPTLLNYTPAPNPGNSPPSLMKHLSPLPHWIYSLFPLLQLHISVPSIYSLCFTFGGRPVIYCLYNALIMDYGLLYSSLNTLARSLYK